jgi:hypothetical protein
MAPELPEYLIRMITGMTLFHFFKTIRILSVNPPLSGLSCPNRDLSP